MLSAKRTQLRNQIRRQQLQQIFAMRRKELISGREGVFMHLFQQIEKSGQRGVSMEMVGALLTCHNAHPQEQNTYIVITNYLFYHNDALPHLLPRLVNSPCYLEHYMWSLSICMFILAENSVRCPRQDLYLAVEDAEKIMEVACDFMREVMATLKRKQTSTAKQINGWLYFIEMLVEQLNYQLYQELPQQSIALFSEALCLQLPQQPRRIQQLIAIWNGITAIFRHKDSIDKIRDLLVSVRPVFVLVLRHLPQQRQQCLKMLTSVLVNKPSDFTDCLYYEPLIKQILYLEQQVHKLKPTIVYLLSMLLSQVNLETLLNLLTLETHKQLTQTLDWSIKTANNECLEQCLKAIYTVMSRLQNDKEQQLLARVQDEIQSLHFDQMIEGMALCQQLPSVWNVLTRIIDDFYSPEEPSPL